MRATNDSGAIKLGARRLTEAGMQIDESAAHCENAREQIREHFEPGSKMTAKRESQPLKHSPPSVSTEEGMQIDESDEQH
jgi:hypothetical protein